MLQIIFFEKIHFYQIVVDHVKAGFKYPVLSFKYPVLSFKRYA